MLRIGLIVLVGLQMAIGWAMAGPPQGLMSGAAPRAAFLQAALPGAETMGKPGSLFAGQSRGGMFEPVARAKPLTGVINKDRGITGLKNLIAKAEAGSAQYDAVVFSARIKPFKPPTQMTLYEIYAWIRETPGQNHAIGRYQFIPSTLRALVKRGNIPLDTVFSPSVQDQLAMYLLEDAGIHRFKAGELSRRGFMNNLAKIWAGLPNSTGRSHYHGFAGNKNTISWETFEAAMKRYFPNTG